VAEPVAGQTAGAAIVAQLEALGVRRAYGVPGESYLEVLDALHDSPIEFVVCRHEGGAGFMALAQARLTGRPGVVMVTRGPGAANAAIAVHTAWQDATPLVLLVGLVPVADRDRESFQEFSLTGWFGSTAKRVLTVEQPDRAAAQLAEAFAVGVPAAVAASLEYPGRQVVSVAGDGCFLMNAQELATATAYGASPVILVADNSQYGTIRQHQEQAHPGRVSGTALVNPDFAAFARSFGGYGERVSRTEDLAAALDRALGSGTAAVLHLDVDPAVLEPRGIY
jgi:thiamine pyrophosphate-dependent acetolactate synthase large subunit-like protein